MNTRNYHIRRGSITYYALKLLPILLIIALLLGLYVIISECHRVSKDYRTDIGMVYDIVTTSNGNSYTKILCSDDNIYTVTGVVGEIGQDCTVKFLTNGTDKVVDDIILEVSF